MSLFLNRLETPAFVAHGIEVIHAIRKDRVVICEADTFPIERILVEYEEEEDAVAFIRALELARAAIRIEEDVSINAEPVKLQKKYIALMASGDRARMKRLLTELWEHYGVDPEGGNERETSGVRRIAIMHDGGVSSYGFRGMKRQLRRWMTAHGFPAGRGLINDFRGSPIPRGAGWWTTNASGGWLGIGRRFFAKPTQLKTCIERCQVVQRIFGK